MCASSSRTLRGFTLIEVVVFIVIVSVGLAGVLASLNVSVRSSSDPLRPKQALAIAESLLEEILLKGYCDPDTINLTTTPPTCGAQGAEARANYDAIEDFDATTSGATTITTDAVNNTWPSGYTASVTTTSTTLGPVGSTVPAYAVTVSVDYGSGSIALTGYRANY